MPNKDRKRFAISCIAVMAISLVQIAVDGCGRRSKKDRDKAHVNQTKKEIQDKCTSNGGQECLKLMKNLTKSYGDYFTNSKVQHSLKQINKRLFEYEEFMIEYAKSSVKSTKSSKNSKTPGATNDKIEGYDKIEGESIVIHVFSNLKSHDATSFIENKTNGTIKIQLNFRKGTDVIVLHCIYKNISILQLDRNSTHQIDSDIHSIKLFYNETDIRNFSRRDAVVLRFKNKGANRINPLCLYLHPTKLEWLSDGLSSQGNSEFTDCYSNHLTHFGVFRGLEVNGRLKPNLKKVPKVRRNIEVADAKALQVIYYIGCVLSLTGVLIMCILYCAFHKDIHVFSSDRYLINLNLLIAIGMTQILFLVGIAAVKNKIFCQAVAVLLHYSTLASLAWMLVEGVVLYLKVIKVYGGEAVRLRYIFIAAWGLPLIIVTCTASTYFEGYTSARWCWLSFDGYFVWSVFGPVAAVILINFIILILVIKTVIKSTSGQRSRSRTFASIRAVLVLFPILGLSWVFGLFALSDDSIIWQYLFIIFNGTQGFLIFVIYGVGKREVRSAFKKLFCAKTLPVNTTSQASIQEITM